jgi:TRAP-type C4-dicarboxylate transport system substrate-binding protein
MEVFFMRRLFHALKVGMLFVVVCTATADATVSLRFSGQNPVDHQSTRHMNRIKEIVEKETNGEIEIKVYPASQLGDYLLTYEELMQGTIDFALVSVGNQFDNKQLLMVTTFLVKDYDDARAFYKRDGWLYKLLEDTNAQRGVRFLGFNGEGFGGLGLTKEPKDPLNPDIDQGVLVRCPPNDNARNTLEAIGYKPVTIPYAETYTAMQTGVCEGWFGGTPAHSYIGFRDVVKHYYALNLYVEVEQFLFSEKIWKKLTPKQQEIIRKACREVSDASWNTAEREDREYMDAMAKEGIVIHEYSSEQLAPIFKKGQEVVWPKLIPLIGEKLVEELLQQAPK